jgi:hypothetical protein
MFPSHTLSIVLYGDRAQLETPFLGSYAAIAHCVALPSDSIASPNMIAMKVFDQREAL